MNITSLKSGLWGYRKNDVCEYIAKMNEEFSQKLMEALKENDSMIQELQAKVAQLEEENAVYRAERDRVTETLMDAKTFAANLKTQATAENEKFCAQNQAYNEKQRERISEFRSGINEIRDAVHKLLHVIDNDLSKKDIDFSELQDNLQIIEETIEKGESLE